MKLLLIIFYIYNINIVYGLFEDYSLSNFLFSVNFNKNSLILNDNNVPLNIKYESFYENNINIKINKIEFNSILSEEFDIYSGVETIMDTNKYYFQIFNIISYSIHNYAKNTLEVSLYLTNFEFENFDNNLIINLSFNCPINYDGKYYLEANNYIIVFSERALLDDNLIKIDVDRFGNNFYLNFPSFKDYLLYNYTIYYNNLY